MRPTDKLLVIAGLGRGLYASWLFQRLLSGAILVGALAVLTAAMVSAIVIGGLWGLYLWLLQLGIEPFAAALSVSALAILLTLGLVIALRQRMQELLRRPSGKHKIRETVDAFLDGLLAD